MVKTVLAAACSCYYYYAALLLRLLSKIQEQIQTICRNPDIGQFQNFLTAFYIDDTCSHSSRSIDKIKKAYIWPINEMSMTCYCCD
jgi:hypothetical protein